MYKAEIVADSLSPQGDRLTTFVVTFPRIVLAEMNTHRAFSRNSASSRAIPFEKMVEAVTRNPFIPVAWQKPHKGMQGREYITDSKVIESKRLEWIEASQKTTDIAIDLHANSIMYINPKNSGLRQDFRWMDQEDTGVTKQLVNRLIEPYMWHTVIITTSDEGLQNFFKLRCPKYPWTHNLNGVDKVHHTHSKRDFTEMFPDTNRNNLEWLQVNASQADIHIQPIAEMMYDAYNDSLPKQLEPGDYHIPFGDDIKDKDVRFYNLLVNEIDVSDAKNHEEYLEKYYYPFASKIAVARCARISYTVVGTPMKERGMEERAQQFTKDIKLFDRLYGMRHYSPFEHVARAMHDHEYRCWYRGKIDYEQVDFYADSEWEYRPDNHPENQGWCRNFKGFVQIRAEIDN